MTNAVEFRAATVRYGPILALDAVDMELPEGAYLAVLGPNGGGKSTLVKAALGLLRPAAGEVLVFGRPAVGYAGSVASYVPQRKSLDPRFPAVALDLVVTGIRRRWPWRITRDDRVRAMEALERVGAEHLAERRVTALSGGQLQRVYLARGFARQARLVLLDEPATGVDAPGQAELYRLVEDYRRDTGCTVILISHDWAVAEHHATHVALLSRRLLAFGAPGTVLTDSLLAETFGHAAHAHSMRVGHADA